MPIKNGRYKDKKGVVRHFETNENMVVVDNGQKTLKQKITEIATNIQEKVDALFVKDITGDKEKLQTTDKTSLVNAINEVTEQIEVLSDKDVELEEQINVLLEQITWKPDGWKNEEAPPSEYFTKRTTIFLSGAHTFNGFANCIVRTVCNYPNTCTQFIDGGYDMMPLCYRQAMPNGTWSEWKEYATTTKTDILLIPKPGFTIHENMSFKINNVVYINTTVYKTDGTSIVGLNDFFEISEKPPTNRAFYCGCFSEKTWGAVEASTNLFCYSDGLIRGSVTSNGLVNGLIISGSYIVG